LFYFEAIFLLPAAGADGILLVVLMGVSCDTRLEAFPPYRLPGLRPRLFLVKPTDHQPDR
jgi:hypothetical protein